jgi:hypothetical protein
MSSVIPRISTSLDAADVSASMTNTAASFRLSELELSLARLPAFFIGTGYGPRLGTTRIRGLPPPLIADAIWVFRLLIGPACDKDEPSP